MISSSEAALVSIIVDSLVGTFSVVSACQTTVLDKCDSNLKVNFDFAFYELINWFLLIRSA